MDGWADCGVACRDLTTALMGAVGLILGVSDGFTCVKT